MNLRDSVGTFLVTAFVGVIFLLLYRAIPKDNEQLIVYMIGQLSGFAAAVIGYHFTTKAGEKEMDAKRTDNTAKALDAIKAAQEAPTQGGGGHGQGAATGAPATNGTPVPYPGPAGTEDKPLIVAGAPEDKGHRPVTTRGAKP